MIILIAGASHAGKTLLSQRVFEKCDEKVTIAESDFAGAIKAVLDSIRPR